MSISTSLKETPPIEQIPNVDGPSYPNGSPEATAYNSARALGMAVGQAFTYQHLLEAHIEDSHYRETHDALTGLSNRQGLNESYDKMQAEDSDDPIGVVMIDLSRFKMINDNEGHAAGDEVLIDFANNLSNGLRVDPSNPGADKLTRIIARRSGDEFVVLTRLGAAADSTDAPEGKDRRGADLTPDQRLAGLEAHIRVIGEEMRKKSAVLQRFNFSAVTGGAIVDKSLGEGLEEADQNLLENKIDDHQTNGKSR